MATFKAMVFHQHIRKDKTFPIRIRVTHNRKVRYIPTGLVACMDDLTKGYRIKNPGFIDSANEIIGCYRTKCNIHFASVTRMTADELVRFLTSPEEKTDLDFLAFGKSHAEKLIAEGRITTGRDYKTALNAVKRFIGRDTLGVAEINMQFLTSFEKWLRQNPIKSDPLHKRTMSRAPSHYLSSIRALHNEMKRQYNDEDSGFISIPYSPFARYRVPAPPVTQKRAISAELVRKIYHLADASPKFNLARDCFTLSFCLMGMNSADLYHCPPIKNNKIVYKRKKTRLRRKDFAVTCAFITREIMRLRARYEATGGIYAFTFSGQYATEANFNKAINQGLKLVGKEIGVPDLTFYAARHSWATIALNKCGIDKYTVHAALNHVDPEMRVTDIYLEKDWSVINKANRKVLDYVFKKQKPG